MNNSEPAPINAVSPALPVSRATEFLKVACYLLVLLELVLGVAHLLWPHYRWGQGRDSYFNFNNTLTLASWLASMQFVGVGILALIEFHRERIERDADSSRETWIWLAAALLAPALSIVEMTRFPDRLKLCGLPKLDAYESFVVFGLWAGLLALFGWFFLSKARAIPLAFRCGVGWLIAWGLKLALTILARTDFSLPARWHAALSLADGLAYLVGGTLLLLAVGSYALRPRTDPLPAAVAAAQNSTPAPFPESRWIFVGVGGMTFTIIFLQIILFQMLTIFADYLQANGIISIALLGISVGGLIGFFSANRAPLPAMIAASLLLPLSILIAFGATVTLMETPLRASVLLTLPFICCSVVITVALTRTRSHVVYFIDLLGAALGALLVSAALSRFREESTLLFLCAFTFLLAACFIVVHPSARARILLLTVLVLGSLTFLFVGGANLSADTLNIVRTHIQRRLPQANILFSRSSLVGRYDVVRRQPTHVSLSAYENGRIIDTLRKRTAEEYQIDPRVPHTLMKDPVILILGMSGDAITKTAKNLGKKVYGVEINPAIVALQTNELVQFNGNSYEGIEVAVMDGRSYLNQSDRKYDMITLMNAHSARGHLTGSTPSPEYLHTVEAMESCLDHLTERGVVLIEEPASVPRREPPVWKILLTMRQALLNRGIKNPDQHFFIFQWKTKTNNYIQLVMKNTLFTPGEISNLKRWVQEAHDLGSTADRVGPMSGPIICKVTLLHSPDEPSTTNYSRILKGEMSDDFLRSRNLCPTTDERPFHFDVDPARPELKRAFGGVLALTALLAPFFLGFVGRQRSALRAGLPYVFVATMTGLAYLLIEIVLMQRYEIFLGAPVVTFATVLGTLLLFSGLGSLWSGGISSRGLHLALGAILMLLLTHLWVIPRLFPLGASWPVSGKILLAVLSIAPLGFFMGVPFAYVLRTGKQHFTESAAAMLFAINAASSALAVPLALNISTALGLSATFLTGFVLYLVVAALLVSVQKPAFQLCVNSFAAAIVALLLVCPWLLSRSVAEVATTTDRYRVYAASYGRGSFERGKMVQGGNNALTPLEWFFWIVQGNGKTILVDTGYDDPAMAEKWRTRNYVQPVQRLQQLGISPAKITDVVLTHAHWDHAGNLAPYKNARIWIQEAEFEHARSKITEEGAMSKGMRWKDVEALLAAEKEGRLRVVRGEQQLAPGISMTLSADHTPGHQFVTVETLDGRVIIGGDSTYLYYNNQWQTPIGAAFDAEANRATIRKMQRIAGSPFLILPGHDPRVTEIFPAVSEGIVHITTIPEYGVDHSRASETDTQTERSSDDNP